MPDNAAQASIGLIEKAHSTKTSCKLLQTCKQHCRRAGSAKVTWKMGASGSELIATIHFESFMPAKCWMAPEMPRAMYSSGATTLPVWPTCHVQNLYWAGIHLPGCYSALRHTNPPNYCDNKVQSSIYTLGWLHRRELAAHVGGNRMLTKLYAGRSA